MCCLWFRHGKDIDVHPSPRAHKTETGPGTPERGRGEDVCAGERGEVKAGIQEKSRDDERWSGGGSF